MATSDDRKIGARSRSVTTAAGFGPVSLSLI